MRSQVPAAPFGRQAVKQQQWRSTGTAATACVSPHCYSIGVLDRNDFTGISGEWHSNNMYLADSDYANGSHINSEMWLAMPNGTWVEEGLRNGVDPGDPCGCTAYEVFWADEPPAAASPGTSSTT